MKKTFICYSTVHHVIGSVQFIKQDKESHEEDNVKSRLHPLYEVTMQPAKCSADNGYSSILIS